MTVTHVNSLPIPRLLQRLIADGKWTKPRDVTALAQLTRVKCPEDFTFLNFEGMERETAGTRKLATDPAMARIYGLASSASLGQAVTSPTVLDVDLAVLIAVNWDEEAIFLDYRDGLANPTIVLSWYPDGNDPALRLLAHDFQSFVEQIGID